MPRAAEPVKTGLTFEEYLELEHASPVKHEFVDGQMFALAGASDKHNRLAFRLATLLEADNQTENCVVYLLDLKMCTPNGVGYYPDVFVTCEEETDTYVKRKPCLIVEILSASTEAIDRGEKLHNYRTFETLQAYVLVNQGVARVEMYRREDDGTWRYEECEAGETLRLPCLGFELHVDDLYKGA